MIAIPSNESSDGKLVDAVELVQRFVSLWKSTWIEPNDKSHMHSEFYEYAVVILATENKLQESFADWWLVELHEVWLHELSAAGSSERGEWSKDWLALHDDITDYVDAHMDC